MSRTSFHWITRFQQLLWRSVAGGTGALLFAGLLAPCVATPAQAQNVAPVELTEVVSGLTAPVGITHAGDGTGRLFIVEQGGAIRIWDGGQLLPASFLQIPVASGFERGLLGLAFHPRYDINGFFYVHYSNPDTSVTDPSDDFQDQTLQGWTVGSVASPYPPKLEPGAGPNGAGDDMMRLESDGAGGAGGRLVVFNNVQWAFDYTAAGVREISMDLHNLGAATLTIRIGLNGDGGEITSLLGHELPPNSGWTTVTFPIEPAAFTSNAGDPVATLASVNHFRILHNPNPEYRGQDILATMGIDNVSALRMPKGPEGSTVVSRFQVTSDPDLADPASEVVLLTQEQPFANHNGGQLAFGPDGYLYVGLGDGGSANDPDNHGQNRNDLLGTLLRLDVPADPNDPQPSLGIPVDNPFVGVADARDEIWAYGLRNPWRFSFDRSTGDLFIADVGQRDVEEIDFQFASSPGGENYGWRLMEGSTCFNPASNCNDGTLVLPVMEYDHGPGCSVTGGYRYRGRLFPSLDGVFFYGDYCAGTIWGGLEDSTGTWTSEVVLSSGFRISTFGEDEDGEVYVADHSGGAIYRIDLIADPPKITAPAAGSVLKAGTDVTATGTGQNLSWRVDRLNDADGDIAVGTGAAITFTVPLDSTAQQQILVELTGDGGKDERVYDIEPAAPPLEANIVANPLSGTIPLTVTFTGAASGGAGGYTFEWDFGDGSTSMEQSPKHDYLTAGNFTATLTVKDSGAGSAAATVAITAMDVAPSGRFSCDQTYLWVSSRRKYECAILATGDRPYTDLGRVLAQIPAELESTAWIRTANRDAQRRRPWFMFLYVTDPVKVTVGFDAMALRLPRWLRRGWTDEGKTVTLDNGRVMNLYSREYPAGWVLLGSNRVRGARWPRRARPLHYVVALTPATAPIP